MFGSFASAIDRLLSIQEALDAARNADYFGYSTTSRGSYPSLNLFQSGDDMIVTAEIPGVKKEDIKIEVKDRLLRVSGQRKIDYPKEASVHRVERRSRNFDRTIKLPMMVDVSKISAEYKNGILKVTLPRAEQDKPREITIH